MEPLANKAEYLLTIAAVPIAALQFTSALRSKHRPLCQKNVKRICKIYRLEGCNRSDEDNFISAVVDPVVYHTACAAPPRMFVSSSNVPLLDLERVECLDGLHRIAAAKSFLDEAEPWWIVKLYSSSKSASPRQRVPADGAKVCRKVSSLRWRSSSETNRNSQMARYSARSY